jgi:hypothetical protein
MKLAKPDVSPVHSPEPVLSFVVIVFKRFVQFWSVNVEIIEAPTRDRIPRTQTANRGAPAAWYLIPL